MVTAEIRIEASPRAGLVAVHAFLLDEQGRIDTYATVAGYDEPPIGTVLRGLGAALDLYDRTTPEGG